MPQPFWNQQRRVLTATLGSAVTPVSSARTGAIEGFLPQVADCSNLPKLLISLAGLFTETLGIRQQDTLLFLETDRTFRACPITASGPFFRIPVGDGDPLVHYFRAEVARSPDSPGSNPWLDPAREQLLQYGAELALALVAHGQLIGLILSTGPASNQPFASQDLQAFEVLAQVLGLFIGRLRLQYRWELLGSISGGLAHDLISYLTPVSTFMQLSRAEQDSPKAQALLPEAYRSLLAIQSTIQQARQMAQQQKPVLASQNLEELLRTAIELARAHGKAVGIELHSGESVQAELDQVLILRVLHNLLMNALAASPPHSRIRVELESWPDPLTGREWARIRVADHGQGIPPDQLARMLDPAAHAGGLAGSDKSTGLGLSICWQIIAWHGGHLDIRSQEGQGTTVEVDLPVHPDT